MAAKTHRIIDAGGHVAEGTQAIIAHMPAAYREKAALQPFNPFPPFDHLHAAHLVDMPAGAFNRKVGPQEWLAFLDDVGLESTVLYPTSGVGWSNIVNPDWAVDAARAYNDWLAETYLKLAEAAGLSPEALTPRQLCLSEQAAAPLRAAGAPDLGVAGEPREDALIGLLERRVSSPSGGGGVR